jgi:hypothetical protein
MMAWNVGICWNRFVCAIQHFIPTRNFTLFKARIVYELNESKVKEDDNKVDWPMTEQLNA